MIRKKYINYIGKNIKEAEEDAHEQEIEIRVIRRDNIDLVYFPNFKSNRINVETINNIIIKVFGFF